MRWAERTDFGAESHPLALAIAKARASGRSVLDLTVSNPTRCGFDYDEATILDALGSPANLSYAAEPLGSVAARQTISDRYYRPKGITLPPERLMLTASTSEAYGYLLRLLCDAGDAVLVPQPSYPLFDLLARMHDVQLQQYPLQLHDGWGIDFQACEQLVSSRTRAIVVVHPNNPTGHFTTEQDYSTLLQFAERHGLSVIADEVFLDYTKGSTQRSFARQETSVLTFVLSGLSKVLAMPQMKLAWTAVCGPAQHCEEAMLRLEFIADTFLSLSSPVSNALERWLPLADGIQRQVRSRLARNLAALDLLLFESGLVSRLPVEGGWSVILRLPANEQDDVVAERLLRLENVLFHPGSFYGLPSRGYLVLSLIVEAETFREGIYRLIRFVHQECSMNLPVHQ